MKPGDIVELLSGSPPLVIETIHSPQGPGTAVATCVRWTGFDANPLWRGDLKLILLKPVHAPSK